jgi:nitroimidazol reductase NimA-like FMN-containing flavoprotein (pyridoxamine 5'-phosphate oxidase superfamily)
MADFAITAQNRVRRLPDRGRFDRETVYSIIDEALYCSVAFVQDGQPYVIPTLHARLDDRLILHGAAAGRLLNQVGSGTPLCVSFTLLDGLVFARSAFHHSMNYRSAVVFGKGERIDDDAEKLWALEALFDHLARGRWNAARRPTPAELRATAVVAIPIESASAKMRTGQPVDDEADYALPVWAGVLPLELRAGQPVADPRLADGIEAPETLLDYTRPQPRPDQKGEDSHG